ncbi:MAG: PepSY-associated TM helix domain-containing protein [Gemmatimonadota bacterium]|nr:PepSY-associated TM helix domain-containing protein [Gemmatimonadota bacterium]MDE2985514.1 PepSY-associated TM helix domain-containing protein [Gemmatimonadota bacterium]
MIRGVLFRLHLSVALAAGLLIVTMAATGVVLACEDVVMSVAERRLSVAVREDTPRLSPDEIVGAAAVWGERSGVAVTATSIEYRNRPGAAVQVHAGRDRRVFVDPYTGEVVGGGFPLLEGFFEGVRGVHRWLGVSGGAMRKGRAVTGAANVAFLFLLLTGPLLWLPRRITRRNLTENLVFRRGVRGPARKLNWHYVVGIWSFVPLAVISVTGVVMSYPGVGDRVYPVVGTVMGGGGDETAGEGRGVGGGQGLAGALAAARAQVPGWRTIVLTLPRPDHAEVRVEVRTGRSGQPQKAAVLAVDRETGAVVSAESFRDESPNHRAQELLRYAHTGEYWGLAGQALAGLSALAVVVLAWTGFTVALVMWRLRRGKRPG